MSCFIDKAFFRWPIQSLNSLPKRLYFVAYIVEIASSVSFNSFEPTPISDLCTIHKHPRDIEKDVKKARSNMVMEVFWCSFIPQFYVHLLILILIYCVTFFNDNFLFSVTLEDNFIDENPFSDLARKRMSLTHVHILKNILVFMYVINLSH